MREGIKATCSCAGNVVQVFGFKNKFPREAGTSFALQKDLKSPNPNFGKLQLWDAVNDDQSSQREKDECVFHLARDCSIASLGAGGSVKTTEVPEVLGRIGVESNDHNTLSKSVAGFMARKL